MEILKAWGEVELNGQMVAQFILIEILKSEYEANNWSWNEMSSIQCNWKTY